jgi:AraC-like DNA-binding protein
MPALPPAHVDLWSGRALVIAPLGSVGRHAHAAMALLVGLDGDFAIRLRGDWHRTRSVLIPAGVAHELECERTLMATLYLFPLTGEPEALARRLGVDPRRVHVDVRLARDVAASLLAIHGGDRERASVGAWLDGLVGPVTPPPVDPRVLNTAALLRTHATDTLTLAELAERVDVSESRLMHLFKADACVAALQQEGVPVTGPVTALHGGEVLATAVRGASCSVEEPERLRFAGLLFSLLGLGIGASFLRRRRA